MTAALYVCVLLDAPSGAWVVADDRRDHEPPWEAFSVALLLSCLSLNFIFAYGSFS